MDPQMMPPQQGGENEQIVDQILMAVEQLMQTAGPEWVMEFLMAGMEAVQGGGEEGMPPEAGMPPEVMSEGGPEAMGGLPQDPGSMAPRRGMMGRKLPN